MTNINISKTSLTAPSGDDSLISWLDDKRRILKHELTDSGDSSCYCFPFAEFTTTELIDLQFNKSSTVSGVRWYIEADASAEVPEGIAGRVDEGEEGGESTIRTWTQWNGPTNQSFTRDGRTFVYANSPYAGGELSLDGLEVVKESLFQIHELPLVTEEA